MVPGGGGAGRWLLGNSWGMLLVGEELGDGSSLCTLMAKVCVH